MPLPNFAMLIKFQITELSENNPHAVKTPRGARQGELVLIDRDAEGQTDTWGMLTAPILSGENEWAYTPLSHEQVCRHLATHLHENNCNFTGEDFVESFNEALRVEETPSKRESVPD